MFLKSDYAAAVLNLPKELEADLQLSSDIHTSLNNKYNFVLSFYTKKQDIEREIPQLKETLLANALLWIAYPKNNALETDLNRDILHKLLSNYGLDGVSIISLNATWSAMRFKQV